MKGMYCFTVTKDRTNTVESLFNKFRIGLGEWSRFIAYDEHGDQIVNYTVYCEYSTVCSIVNILNR